MSNVKWIKLSTAMFEDEKIRLIERMPDADTILVIWVKLLAQAGRTNASGYIYLSENIPYTDEMLATIFDRPLNTVRLALETFRKFGMIDIDENSFISISNWSKHQSIDKLAEIREKNRIRQAKHRGKNKLEEPKEDNNVTVTLRNALDIDKELDIELDKEKEYIPFSEIISYLNDKTGKNYRASTNKTKTCIKARWNEGFRLDDFKKVIDTKTSEWKNDSKMSQYLRPETLFGNKFEGYLNQQTEQKPTDPYDQLF
ncbi:hypothetical protein J18TS1_12180 [Oceanobacillus oncorhynchi subsp. incaldanensis]|uniref:phage replisome organizer N-terminal domain-containing protein n=1 Tax=Oceanobacillus oncorhynchi TaxID=545501 RepID=UPI001B03F94A|nr:phage replisome organizer N-terminal domain-containing protein [Oceanobacillus oncorhynchi]GIO18118.1 hypothetical protein J18TS1_12180 [Oceanobacillus oncorhynchi subsp. incaldanensis]